MGNPLEDQKFYGFHRGIVIQSNDVEKRGRVKILIPELGTQLSRIVGENVNPPNERFEARFCGGQNINTFLDSERLELAKKGLFWCEQASPLIGSGTSGTYDIKNNIATVGEGHRGAPFEPLGDDSITPSGESVSPKACLSINGTPGLCDIGSKTGTADTYNQSFAPAAYNNAVKGLLSIPKVGAQVWVFFENGSIMHPVYFGYVFDKSDWHSIFNTQESNPDLHYPAGSENIKDNEPYFSSGKMVLNSKAGSIEFIETDDMEKFKISHYSGSFYEMNNHITTEVSIENKSTIINEQEHHSVKSSRTVVVNGESHNTYKGNYYATYGDKNNKLLYEQWMQVAEPVFQHATTFNKTEIKAKDPTQKGEAKSNCNNNYSHPDKLTLERSDWNLYIKSVTPKSYKKIVQHTYLNVK